MIRWFRAGSSIILPSNVLWSHFNSNQVLWTSCGSAVAWTVVRQHESYSNGTSTIGFVYNRSLLHSCLTNCSKKYKQHQRRISHCSSVSCWETLDPGILTPPPTPPKHPNRSNTPPVAQTHPNGVVPSVRRAQGQPKSEWATRGLMVNGGHQGVLMA